MLKTLGVNLRPLKIDTAAKNYLFAAKVYACAQAEKLLAGKMENLVWFDNPCLVFAPLDDTLLFKLPDHRVPPGARHLLRRGEAFHAASTFP